MKRAKRFCHASSIWCVTRYYGFLMPSTIHYLWWLPNTHNIINNYGTPVQQTGLPAWRGHEAHQVVYSIPQRLVAQVKEGLMISSLLKSADMLTYTGHDFKNWHTPISETAEITLGNKVFDMEVMYYGYEFMSSLTKGASCPSLPSNSCSGKAQTFNLGCTASIKMLTQEAI